MNIYNYKISIIICHLLLGYSLSYWETSLLTYYIWSLFFLGIVLTLKNNNKSGEAHLFSGYMVGIEVMLRMTNANVFWEFGKYTVIVLFGLGMIIENRPKNIPKPMVLFILLLLPAIIINDSDSFQIWRKEIAFNVSGLFSLAISTIYFYRREFNKDEIKRLFFLIILPIISTVVVMFFKQGNFSNIVFENLANFQTSGGFGPNQVSTILGLGVVLVGLSILFKLPIVKKQLYNYILLGVFLIFGLLTFSRGGMIAAVIALGIGWLLYFFKKQNKKLTDIFRGIAIISLFLFAWDIISDMTNDIIFDRYASTIDDDGSFDFTNRIKIFNSELEIFNDNFWFGVGVGQSGILHRNYSLGSYGVTHTEFGRMLAEHGLLGFINIIILLFLPVRIFYFEKNINNQIFLLVFVSLSFLTMFHSAMRLAMPGFIYGLAMIELKLSQEKK